MSPRLPPLNALKTFESAARHLSFTKAAAELFVTQAAVSHQIKALETHLGLKLFKRQNRALLLTEQGQSYFLDIKDIFSSIYDATEKLMSKGGIGALTVCIQPSLAIQWLVPRLSAFSKQYPNIDVRIKADDRDDNTLENDVDIAFYYGRGPWPNVVSEKVLTEYLQPVYSPLLVNGNEPITDIKQLNQYTLLHETSRANWKRWFKHCNEKSSNVDQGPIFSHTALALQAAIHGQGVALINNVLAKPDIEAGRLIAPFSKVLVNKDAFYIVCKDENAENPKVKQFKEWVMQTVLSEEGDISKGQLI